MDDTIERKERNIGKVRVVTRRVFDNDPDYSWLGKYCDFRQPRTKDEKLVHRATGLILDHRGVWRDEKGRIAAEPEDTGDWRNYHYTFHSNGHGSVKYAYRDHRRMEDLNNGGWWFIGIVVSVELDGAEIGYASCYGYESDSGEEYFEEEERGLGFEAIKEAKAWMGRKCRVAA